MVSVATTATEGEAWSAPVCDGLLVPVFDVCETSVGVAETSLVLEARERLGAF